MGPKCLAEKIKTCKSAFIGRERKTEVLSILSEIHATFKEQLVYGWRQGRAERAVGGDKGLSMLLKH
jgi:hypothetical protein